MNRTQLSVTSPGSQSVLPDAWIEKLFQKFEDFYGAKWAAQYGDFPRDRVKRTWAEELSGFADMPGAIAGAISAQKSSLGFAAIQEGVWLEAARRPCRITQPPKIWNAPERRPRAPWLH